MSATVTPPAPTEQPTELKRAIGPKLLLLFIMGDILGIGVYALTGQVAGEVGGAAWLPFLIAFAVATITAFSYLELVTKYPQAAGAALYVHKAFGIHFVTFIVMFVVICSGITSASAGSIAFSSNFAVAFGFDGGPGGTLAVAIVFMLLTLAVNLRGVAEGIGLNVVFTLIELSGLLLVIMLGSFAIFAGNADLSRVVLFETGEGKSLFLAVSTATSLAFFAMVGFEDSVNMAEETKDPSKTFPRMLLTGLSLAAVIYVLVSIVSVAVVPVGKLAASETPLTTVVQTAVPDFPIAVVLPFISMFAVANGALINMLMASRLIYGMSKQQVLPAFLGRVLPRRRTPYAAVLFTTALAVALITFLSLTSDDALVSLLGGTTSLLLLSVFAVVNAVVLVLRRDPVDHQHFRAPTALPVVGVIACVYLVLPWTSGRDIEQYAVAGALLAIGIVLWGVTVIANKAIHRGAGDLTKVG